MRIDLHLHTTASDGQCTPTDLVTLARNLLLHTIAITDHDTTDGIPEAIQAASDAIPSHGISTGTGRASLSGMPFVIPGIELSAEDASGDVHMLGYCIDIHNAALQTRLTDFRRDRAERAQKIVKKLNALGIPVKWERVLEIALGSGKKRGAIGRPHVARAMIEIGCVDSISEAFQRYLGTNGPAYVSRERLSPEGAIDLIHSAGGAAVLAHPAKVKDYLAMVHRLAPAGLDGVEVVHPANNDSVRLDLRGLAKQYDLVMTGGSDFHGVDEQGNKSIGTLTPPDNCIPLITERASRYAKN